MPFVFEKCNPCLGKGWLKNGTQGVPTICPFCYGKKKIKKWVKR